MSDWVRKRERMFDGQKYMVNDTTRNAIRYRIYGRWVIGEGYFYRAEYELPTGWWPIGKTQLLRDAKALVEQHGMSA